MADPNIDPTHGAGGSYVIDPVTGERQLVERTAEPPRDAPTDGETDPQPE